MGRFSLFSEKEKDIIVSGLTMRRNFVTTGNIHFSTDDIIAMGVNIAKLQKAEFRLLTNEQEELVEKLNELITEIYKE